MVNPPHEKRIAPRKMIGLGVGKASVVTAANLNQSAGKVNFVKAVPWPLAACRTDAKLLLQRLEKSL
jgi:hypothetical protein